MFMRVGDDHKLAVFHAKDEMVRRRAAGCWRRGSISARGNLTLVKTE